MNADSPGAHPGDDPHQGRRTGPTHADAERAPEALDLRLAAPALLAWAVAAWGVGADPASCLTGAALAALAATAGLPTVVRYRAGRHRYDPRPGADTPDGSAFGPVCATVVLAALAAGSVLAVTAAALSVRERDPLRRAVKDERTVTLVATVATTPRAVATGDATVVLVELAVTAVDGEESAARAVVLGDAQWLEVDLGQRVRVRIRPRPADPGSVESAVVSGRARPQVLAPASGSLALVGALRNGLVEAVGREPPAAAVTRWPAGSHALVAGLALGDDHALPQQVRQDMRETSLTHLTAVSGQHVVIVLGLVLEGLGMVPRRPRAVIGALVLTGLVVLVRPESSVLRAAAMGAVMLAGVAAGRRSAAVPALSGAVLILMLVDPWQARQIGFALSVAATAGILLGARALEASLSRTLPRWLAALVALPMAAQAACGPLLVLMRPNVSLWAVPANVLVAPSIPVVTVCGLAAVLVAPLWTPAASLLAWPALIGCAWIAWIARVCADLPGASVDWPAGAAGALSLAACQVLALAVVSRRVRSRIRRAVGAAVTPVFRMSGRGAGESSHG